MLEPIAVVYFPFYYNDDIYYGAIDKYLEYIILVNLFLILLSIWLSWIISKTLTKTITQISELITRTTLFGKEMKPDSYDLKAKIGVIFQEVAVFDELNVYDNINYFCGLYIRDKKRRKQYVDDAINLVGLNDFKKFLPKQLSGGLLRRLNIACGIAHKPKLIFLDEPTVAVDPQSRNHILDGIKKLRDQGATIVYTTHYMEEVEILCDRIIIFYNFKNNEQGNNYDLK